MDPGNRNKDKRKRVQEERILPKRQQIFLTMRAFYFLLVVSSLTREAFKYRLYFMRTHL